MREEDRAVLPRRVRLGELADGQRAVARGQPAEKAEAQFRRDAAEVDAVRVIGGRRARWRQRRRRAAARAPPGSRRPQPRPTRCGRPPTSQCSTTARSPRAARAAPPRGARGAWRGASSAEAARGCYSHLRNARFISKAVKSCCGGQRLAQLAPRPPRGMRRLSTLRPAALRTLQRRFCTSPAAIFTPAQRDALARRLRCARERPSPDDAALRSRNTRRPALFAGEFPTGIYPDEWHWREGISLRSPSERLSTAGNRARSWRASRWRRRSAAPPPS